MAIPVKGEEPGAFLITSKRDGTKFVMTERTLSQAVATMGETTFERYFTGEWVVLTEEERKLAAEIRKGVVQNGIP